MVNNAKNYVRCISKPSYVSQKIFSKHFVAIHEIKPVLTPIYVEFSSLDLSKLLMYEFHYKYIKSKFDANLLFTDTDSLVYEINAEDVYENFCEDKGFFYFNDYSLNSLKFFDPVYEVITKMKDDFKGRIVSEFIGLKSKIYSLVDADDEEVTKAKGVNKKNKT